MITMILHKQNKKCIVRDVVSFSLGEGGFVIELEDKKKAVIDVIKELENCGFKVTSQGPKLLSIDNCTAFTGF